MVCYRGAKGKKSRERAEEQCDKTTLNKIFSTFLCAFFPFSTENGIHFPPQLTSPLQGLRSLQNTPELHPVSSCAGVQHTLKQKSMGQDSCRISGGTPSCFSFLHDLQCCCTFNAWHWNSSNFYDGKFFKGSRHWLSSPLQWTLKADIVFIISKSQTKLNHFAWTGQLANYEYCPFFSPSLYAHVPYRLILTKVEVLQRYHVLVLKLYSSIFIQNNFCPHFTTIKNLTRKTAQFLL